MAAPDGSISCRAPPPPRPLTVPLVPYMYVYRCNLPLQVNLLVLYVGIPALQMYNLGVKVRRPPPPPHRGAGGEDQGQKEGLGQHAQGLCASVRLPPFVALPGTRACMCWDVRGLFAKRF